MKHILTEKNKDLIYLLKKKKTQKPFHLGEKPGNLHLFIFQSAALIPLNNFCSLCDLFLATPVA